MNQPPSSRDLRIDFFRGLALAIIFIDHTPNNLLGNFTPRMFGLSDSAEIFIFLAGVSSALAFGRSFERAGWFAGLGRVAQRVWQLYRAHIGLFVAVFAIAVAADQRFGGGRYVASLNLTQVLADPGTSLVKLLSLGYLPNLFDILPLYMFFLAGVPLMVLCARISPRLVIALSVALYVIGTANRWNPVADPATGRPWFFDPFAWQILFVIGYGFGARWFDIPRITVGRLVLAAAVLALGSWLVFAMRWPLHAGLLSDARDTLAVLARKTDLGVLRLLYFFAQAYVVVALLRLLPSFPDSRLARQVVLIGQHSLPVFVLGVMMSFIGGIVFDRLGVGLLPNLLVNGGGVALLWIWASGAAWFARQPWRQPRGELLGQPGRSRASA